MIVSCSNREECANTYELFEVIKKYEDLFDDNKLRVKIESNYQWTRETYEYTVNFNWEEER